MRFDDREPGGLEEIETPWVTPYRLSRGREHATCPNRALSLAVAAAAPKTHTPCLPDTATLFTPRATRPCSSRHTALVHRVVQCCTTAPEREEVKSLSRCLACISASASSHALVCCTAQAHHSPLQPVTHRMHRSHTHTQCSSHQHGSIRPAGTVN